MQTELGGEKTDYIIAGSEAKVLNMLDVKRKGRRGTHADAMKLLWLAHQERSRSLPYKSECALVYVQIR